VYLFSLFLCPYTRQDHCRLCATTLAAHSAAGSACFLIYFVSFSWGWNLVQLPAWWMQLMCPCWLRANWMLCSASDAKWRGRGLIYFPTPRTLVPSHTHWNIPLSFLTGSVAYGLRYLFQIWGSLLSVDTCAIQAERIWWIITDTITIGIEAEWLHESKFRNCYYYRNYFSK
jgi:hypothetical protein